MSRLRPSEEDEVVAVVWQTLVKDGFAPVREFLISQGNRPDIMVIEPDVIGIVECKRRVIIPSHIRQARRYVDAARLRWPGREVFVLLAGPKLDPRLPDATAEIGYWQVTV